MRSNQEIVQSLTERVTGNPVMPFGWTLEQLDRRITWDQCKDGGGTPDHSIQKAESQVQKPVQKPGDLVVDPAD